MDSESGAKRPTQFPLDFRPATHSLLDLSSKFTRFPGRLEIQPDPLPDLPHAQLIWADLTGPQIYHLSVYLFAAGAKDTKYPLTGLRIDLRV